MVDILWRNKTRIVYKAELSGGRCTVMANELTMGEVMAEIPSRLIGFNDVWRDNSTGTKAFFILWTPVWWKSFSHSTAMFD